MTYPTESFAGAATPTWVASTFSASATSATFHDLTTWTELGTNDPLGTSGHFVIVVDYGKTTEEKILCSALNRTTKVITFVQRGYDDTTQAVHSAGSAGTPNCFPVLSANDVKALQTQIGVVGTSASNAQSTASSAASAASGAQSTANTALANAATAQSTANAKVASVTAADSTITVAGTSTAPTVKVGTVPYAQLSGTPSSLPPSGSAGGDLTGSYPNPTLAALSPSPAGTYGSSTKMPVITIDAKGRITSASEITPATDAPSGPAGGDLSGTYPNPSVVAGSTTQAGKLQLTDSTASTSTTTAATPNSVKSAYDLAAGKVASVTAGDSTVTIGGTATAPTVAVSQANLAIAESQVTGLVTDLAGKAPTTRTISTTAPLSGGGDLSANRTLTIADASTSAKGAVQLTDSTASTSITTAATPNSVKSAYDLANAALPKSGGTMSGNIAMNSVARMTGLLRPSALGQPMRVDEGAGITGPSFYTQNPIYAWTTCIDNVLSATSLSMVTGTTYVVSLVLPYDATITGVRMIINQGATGVTSANLALMNATTTLAATTSTAPWTVTGINTSFAAFSSTVALTAGTYWLAFVVNFSTLPPVLQGVPMTNAQMMNLSQTATTNSLATTRLGTGITIPAIGSSLTTTPTPTGNVRMPFMALY